MQKRRTSHDRNYQHGDLSVFPHALDTHFTLFEAKNNLETKLSHKLLATDKYIIVENAAAFPTMGMLRIAPAKGTAKPEILYYASKIGNQFHTLQRGQGPTPAGTWDAGAIVSSPVMAEHHNALKDAIIKIQRKVGLADNPDSKSLHGIIRTLEQRWMAPKPIFKAFPTVGAPPLTVRFQNFSGGHGMHYLWDFGDGGTSTEKHPVHTYLTEGNFTVKLNMVSVIKAQGYSEKGNYIKVNNELRLPFFYGSPVVGKSKTTEFTLVDQTDGSIIERHWFFGDGTDQLVSNPNKHSITHVYDRPGSYEPSLLVRYSDNQMSRATIIEGITVI